jgi:hypothetical protein
LLYNPSMADQEYNSIGTGVDFSQLREAEKDLLMECVRRLTPFGWNETTLQQWYVHRKLSVVREKGVTRYYGRVHSGAWRPLLEAENGKLRWHVGDFQWLPLEEKEHP